MKKPRASSAASPSNSKRSGVAATAGAPKEPSGARLSMSTTPTPPDDLVTTFKGPVTKAEAKALDERYEALKTAPPGFDKVESEDEKALRRAAEDLGAAKKDVAGLSKDELTTEVLRRFARRDGLAFAEGVVEILPDGYGFLRSADRSFFAGPDDVYVAPSQIRRFGLRPGALVQGQIRPPKPSEKFSALLRVEAVDGASPDRVAARKRFEDLLPAHPRERYTLEIGSEPFSTRVVDLLAPIGKGQRTLVVAPPRSGKTTILAEIADAFAINHPEAALIVLLVDERPEEAAELKKRVKGDVIASTFDDVASRHLQIADLTLQRAKRLVEGGRDVVVLLDSLTRLARASNNDAPAGGRVLSGGVEATALARPKKFFGAARAIEGGGSLTIVATALVETGSRMDDVIFEEFKGTGNSEIVLDRTSADRRIFPAVDVAATGTRREELLLDEASARKTATLRAVLAAMPQPEALGLLIAQMRRFSTNAALLGHMRA